jgi:hypothetical protein
MTNYYTKADLANILADFDEFERKVFRSTKKKITDQRGSPFPDLTKAYKSLREAESIEDQALGMYSMPNTYSDEFSGLLGLTADAIDQVKEELEKARQSYQKR